MIKAEIVADSLSLQGDRLTSVLVTFPRIILAEINTHRMLSKNTSSSRAIPFNKMVEAVQENPFIPIAWQKAHNGMQGTEYITDADGVYNNNFAWLAARDNAVLAAKEINDNSVTKQLCNRLLEPFMWTTMLITGSKEGWQNFFELRCPRYEFDGRFFKSIKEVSNYIGNCEFVKMDGATAILTSHNTTYQTTNKGQAEIHMMDLAEKIYDAFNESTPKQLKAGEWHIPMVDKIPFVGNLTQNIDVNNTYWKDYNEQNKVKISVAMAARTSYTVVGDEKEVDYGKMIKLHDRLISQNPPHSSPMEHCARAMSDDEYNSYIKGEFIVTHSEPEYEDLGEFPESAKGWCRNFKGFIQYRHIVENEGR